MFITCTIWNQFDHFITHHFVATPCIKNSMIQWSLIRNTRSMTTIIGFCYKRIAVLLGCKSLQSDEDSFSRAANRFQRHRCGIKGLWMKKLSAHVGGNKFEISLMLRDAIRMIILQSPRTKTSMIKWNQGKSRALQKGNSEWSFRTIMNFWDEILNWIKKNKHLFLQFKLQ